MTKFALPTLFILIFALFYFSVTSRSPDAPPQVVYSGQRPNQTADFEKSVQDRNDLFAKAIDGIRDELKRLSESVKTNSDNISAIAAPSSANGDKTAVVVLDQVNTLRSDYDKLVKDAKEGADRTAQALRQEIATSQGKLTSELAEALRNQTARSEALAQRLEAMKAETDAVKKGLDEDRQNASNISPGLALVVALAALVLGPFVARQFTANQLAAAKKQSDNQVAATERPPTVGPPTVGTDESNEPTASHDAAFPPHEVSLHTEAPKLSEETPDHGDSDLQRNTEKV